MKPKQSVAPSSKVKLPPELRYLWERFHDLLAGIAPSGMAPLMVSWRDIVAYQAVTGIEFEPWEARALVKLGSVRAVALTPKDAK